LAVDGVREINQDAVAAAGGFPFTITQPGSYRLTGNLNVSGATGAINVTAANVTIDLNGFEVAGPVTCTHDGGNPGTVSCAGASSTGISGPLAVRNGTVRGFTTGITARSGQSLTLDHVVATSNAQDGVSPGNERFIATDSVFSLNGDDGIDGQTSGSLKIVQRCAFDRIGDNGIYLDAGVLAESTFVQIGEAVRSNVGRGALIENNYFERNGNTLTINSRVGYRSNVFHNNTSNPGGGVNLGQNLCDGVLCP
jgi:hypothetical protein